MLSIILTDSRIILANNLIIKTLVYFRPQRGVFETSFSDLARVRHLVLTSSRDTVVISVESVSIQSERMLLSIIFLALKVRDSLIFNVLIRGWIIDHTLINRQVISLLRLESQLKFWKLLLMFLDLLILAHVLSRT